MKKLLLVLTAVFFLLACGGTKEESKGTEGASKDSAATKTEKLVIGATPVPHQELLELVKEDLKAQGVELEIVQFNDYIQPNKLLGTKELDANFFQHVPYMEQFGKENNLDLVSVGGVHVEPMAVYSKKIKNLNDLKAGDTILIPNDPTNAGRALILLDKAGVIKLKDNKNLQATVNDITENPKNIKIAQLAPEQLAPRLEEVAAAVINANFALDAKLSAGETLFVRYWLFNNKINIISDEIGSGTGTDGKVKYDAGDTTAGYIADKFVAGTGISLAEGTGANENKLVITNTGAGSGGMSVTTYDPTNVAGDAFDMDNMIEGDTNLILTADERTKIGNALTYFTLTYYQAKPATCATGETCFDNTDGKVYTATGTDTWGAGVAASTSVLYVWQYRIYEFVTGTTLKPLSYGRKLRKSPTVTSNAFSWGCSGESSKSFVSNNANTTCTVTPVSGDEDTEHSLLFTNSDSSASHTISFAAASGFTLKMIATTLTIPASGFVELSVELYGTVCYIKYSIN